MADGNFATAKTSAVSLLVLLPATSAEAASAIDCESVLNVDLKSSFGIMYLYEIWIVW